MLKKDKGRIWAGRHRSRKCDRICRALTSGRTPLIPHPVQLCGCCSLYKAVEQLADVGMLLLMMMMRLWWLLLLLLLLLLGKVVVLLLLLVRVVRVLGHSLLAGWMLQLLLGSSHPL